MCYSEIEKFCETGNDISHLTKWNLRDVMKSWKQRLSQKCTGTLKSSTSITEWLGMKSASVAKEDTSGSLHMVCT
jgi:hypothetical protein